VGALMAELPGPVPVLLADLEEGEANRSVLVLLAWLDRTGRRARVIARLDGQLRAEFERVADVFVAHDWRLRRPSTALQAVRLHRPAEIARSVELRRRLGAVGPVAYLAGIGAAPLLAWLRPGTAVVGHLHHRAGDALADLGPEPLALLRDRVSTWVTGSDDAAKILADRLQVEARATTHLFDLVDSTELLPGLIPTGSRATRDQHVRALLHERLGIPVDVPLVCGRGHVDFWHVSDVFAQFCWNLLLRDPAAATHCLWIGDGSTDRMVWPLLHDIRHAGLDGQVHVYLGGEDIPPLECVAASDVQVFTNRRPADLGQVRATAAVGTVTVGFEGSAPTGDAIPLGRAVPWIDVAALAGVTHDLLEDPGERRRLGAHDPDGPPSWDVRSGGPLLLELLAEAARR
jgi:hypothetical protein